MITQRSERLQKFDVAAGAPEPTATAQQPAVDTGVQTRILRTEAEIDTVREQWAAWQNHPHVDLDFFRTIVRVRSEVISPYVIALYRNDALETLLVGRLETGRMALTVGYWDLARIPVRTLSFVYRGLLGNDSADNCAALLRTVNSALKREGAHFASMHFVKVGSPLHRASSQASHPLLHGYFAETRPHWVMRLPGDIEELYRSMSSKTRQTRRYQVKRLQKRFPTMRFECYTKETDLDRVFTDAETVACRTYQRGLGVGFIANQENRERFMVEASRNRFRAFFLYIGDKPIAFFLGTLSGNVLYDNFTSYDPEFGNYSPGTVLFLLIFERLCRDGVEALDFGFGDAPYKAQFGNERSEETTLSMFAPTLSGMGLNLLRTPAAMLDLIGKWIVDRLAVLGSVKKRWRQWAQRRTTA